jgi:hypothetical protein
MINPLEGASPAADAGVKKRSKRAATVVAPSAADASPNSEVDAKKDAPPPAAEPSSVQSPKPVVSQASTSAAAAASPSDKGGEGEKDSQQGKEKDKNMLFKAFDSIGETMKDGIGGVGNKFKKVGRAIISIGGGKKKDGDDGDENNDKETAAADASSHGSPDLDAAKKEKREKKDKKDKREKSLVADSTAPAATAEELSREKEKREKRERKAAALLSSSAPSAAPSSSAVQPAASQSSDVRITSESAAPAAGAPAARGAFGGGGARPRSTSAGAASLVANFDLDDDAPAPHHRHHHHHHHRKMTDDTVELPCTFLSVGSYANVTGVCFYSVAAPAELSATAGKSAVVAVADERVVPNQRSVLTATAASTTLREIESRLSSLRRVSAIWLSKDDLRVVFPTDSSLGSARAKTNRIMTDAQYSPTLPLLLSAAGVEHRWGRVPCGTLGDPSGTFVVPVMELRNSLDDVFENLEVRCMAHALPSAAVGAGGARISSLLDDHKGTRSQLVQTRETVASLDDMERDIRDSLRKEIQSAAAAAEAERKSLRQVCVGLEADVAKRAAELREAEKRHLERETRLLEDIDRLKRDVLERTAFIMKLKKTTNPAAALIEEHRPEHTSADIGEATATRSAAQGPAAGPGSGGGPSDQAVQDALLRVRQSIADGEKFIEGMRKRAASPPAVVHVDVTPAPRVVQGYIHSPPSQRDVVNQRHSSRPSY